MYYKSKEVQGQRNSGRYDQKEAWFSLRSADLGGLAAVHHTAGEPPIDAPAVHKKPEGHAAAKGDIPLADVLCLTPEKPGRCWQGGADSESESGAQSKEPILLRKDKFNNPSKEINYINEQKSSIGSVAVGSWSYM